MDHSTDDLSFMTELDPSAFDKIPVIFARNAIQSLERHLPDKKLCLFLHSDTAKASRLCVFYMAKCSVQAPSLSLLSTP